MPEIIEKRKPLSDTARRAGWVECNIGLNQIPVDGRILFIKDEKVQSMDKVISQVQRTKFISQYNLPARGWILDVLNCVNKIDGKDFSLDQMYQFEKVLSQKYPDNHHVKDKIRQQLQILRDRGMIESCGNGHYRKIQGA